MIDLHIHTKYSDGTWDVKKLLEEAQKSNIEILSITDHDTLKAYQELEKMEYQRIYDGDIITGVEFSTVYDGIFFHLLGYGFDYNKIKNWMYENYEMRKPNLQLEFDYIINSCKRNKIKIDNIKYDKNKGWPIDIIFPEIKKYEENKRFFKDEEWNNIDVFFNSAVTNKNFPAFVDFSIHYPKADVVANEVKKAGGKTFIAHVYRYNLENPFLFINNLNEKKIIDGIEVYYSSFNEEETNLLKKYCEDNHLLVSGGTDCHGEKKSSRKIGIGYGNMNINKDIILNWF